MFEDFGFGYILGVMSGIALIIFIAVIATAGDGHSYNEVQIELACRQEFNNNMASRSANLCPGLMDRLEEIRKE